MVDKFYEGVWVSEGHTVSYEQHGEEVSIRETIDSPNIDVYNSHVRTSLESAIKNQNKYIELGYDKIS
tara:strand:- start:339 stop:542 length:204 start_codon:yes stop_codon:yes gene_type:complete